MADPTLNDISQDDFTNAESAVIAAIRQAYPTLDLRKGTVIRDILVRPDAALRALDLAREEQIRKQMSLTTLQASGDSTDPALVDPILANFLITRQAGLTSTGSLLIKISSARTVGIASGTQFVTLTGLTFVTARAYTIKQQADVTNNEIELQTANDGSYYFFILPVVAAAAGVQYNIAQATMVDPVTSIFGFVSAEAYADFSGGLDAETVSQIIARMPVAISNRSLTSRTSIEAQLRDAFAVSGPAIQALGIQGMGDAAQLRDKHNPMGFAVGSRVDIYPRTFLAPVVLTLQKTGTLVGQDTYQFTIDAADAPGFYAIRSISEPESTIADSMTFGVLPAIGSYAFVEVRAAEGIQDTFHDIDPANSMIETAYSVFQKSVVTVSGVAQTGQTHDFKVELYVAPGIAAMQTYVDSTAIRNVEADFLVRCPLMCSVGLKTTLYYPAGVTIDSDAMTADLCTYINSRNFVQYLTRSELASIMLQHGATRVDLSSNGTVLKGYVRDAAGVTHELTGDTLDISKVASGAVLLVPETCVFVAEPYNINITAVEEA